jgi:ribosome recycling factor
VASLSAPSFTTDDHQAAGYAGAVIEETVLEAIEKMEKAVEHVAGQFTTVRTGRATPALVEKLVVDYYGSPVPLQQLAGFQVPEPRQLVVKPHDRGSLGAVEKAIRDSDLGMNPTNDGVVIRLNFPPLTEERRKEYVKVVKHMAEDGRVAVRNIRRDARKHLEAAEKAGEISADELERAEKELDKITHDHVDHIDKALGRKEHELLEV